MEIDSIFSSRRTDGRAVVMLVTENFSDCNEINTQKNMLVLSECMFSRLPTANSLARHCTYITYIYI